MACLINLGGISLNKNNITKSILAILVVIGILAITGLYYWLIFSQAKDFTFIIIIMMTAIISATLVLFVYNLMLKMKPKNKDEEVKKSKIKETKIKKPEIKEAESEEDENDYVDLYSLSNTESPKIADTKNKKTNDSTNVKTV